MHGPRKHELFGKTSELEFCRVTWIRTATRYAIAFFYTIAGIAHLRNPASFMLIVPPGIPFPHFVVIFTGVCELAGSFALFLSPPWQRSAGCMLALYALCVWPANIYQALYHIHVPLLPDSWWYHAPRLLFQPVLIWCPLFATGWPLRKMLIMTRRDS
jgi:uncharacterized membrane protein